MYTYVFIHIYIYTRICVRATRTLDSPFRGLVITTVYVCGHSLSVVTHHGLCLFRLFSRTRHFRVTAESIDSHLPLESPSSINYGHRKLPWSTGVGALSPLQKVKQPQNVIDLSQRSNACKGTPCTKKNLGKT